MSVNLYMGSVGDQLNWPIWVSGSGEGESAGVSDCTSFRRGEFRDQDESDEESVCEVRVFLAAGRYWLVLPQGTFWMEEGLD